MLTGFAGKYHVATLQSLVDEKIVVFRAVISCISYLRFAALKKAIKNCINGSCYIQLVQWQAYKMSTLKWLYFGSKGRFFNTNPLPFDCKGLQCANLVKIKWKLKYDPIWPLLPPLGGQNRVETKKKLHHEVIIKFDFIPACKISAP